MTLKMVELEHENYLLDYQTVGISKMKNKCLLITNLESLKEKNVINSFWLKNQVERKKKFKEILSNLLV